MSDDHYSNRESMLRNIALSQAVEYLEHKPSFTARDLITVAEACLQFLRGEEKPE